MEMNQTEASMKNKASASSVIFVWVEAILLYWKFMIEEEEQKKDAHEEQTQMSV